MDLELHFDMYFIHLTTVKGYIEMLYCPSLDVSLLGIFCASESPFSLFFDGLRILTERAKAHKNGHVLVKAMASYAVVKR